MNKKHFTHKNGLVDSPHRKARGLPRSSVAAMLVLLACLSFGNWRAGAAVVNYTAQTTNFTQTSTQPSGFAGFFNFSGTQLGVFANGGSSGSAPQAVGYHNFTVNGTLGGTAQALRVGQQAQIYVQLGSSHGGINGNSIGFSLNNGSTFSSVANYRTGSRLEYSFTGGDSSAKVYDSGTQSTGLPGFTAFQGGLTYTVTLVSSNEYNFTVSGTGGAVYNIFTLGGTANSTMDSFSVFNRGYNNDDAVFGSISVTDVPLTYTANTGETKTVAGIIPDDGAIANTVEKLGVGEVILAATNTYSGITKVSAGTLTIQTPSALGSTGSNTTVFAGATLQIKGNTTGVAEPITLYGQTNSPFTGTDTNGALRSPSGTNSITGNITLASMAAINTDAGQLTVSAVTNSGFRLIAGSSGATVINGALTGTGDLLKQGTGTLTLAATNTFGSNSSVFIDNGTVLAATNNALGATDGSTTGYVNLGASSQSTSGNGSVLITAPGITISNPFDARYFTGVTGGKTIGGNNTSGTATFAGSVALHDTLSITAAVGGTVKIGGPITLGGGITTGQSTNTANVLFAAGPGLITTGGTVEFDGTNTFTGETYVKSGTLQFNTSAAVTNSTIRLGDDAATSTASVNIANPTGGGVVNVVINSRAGTGGVKTIAGSNTGGTNTYSGGIFFDGDTTVASTNAGGTLAFTNATFDIKNHVMTVTGSGVTDIRSVVQNSTAGGSVIKQGTGTLILEAADTYSGNTTISAGKLKVSNTSGSATGSGNVAVNASGTLTGPGSVSGTVTLDGTISPGSSPGSLTTGAETWDNGGHYTWEINSATGSAGSDPGWDLLTVNGALNIAATAGGFNLDLTGLNLSDLAGAVNGFNNASSYTWTIVHTTGGITGFNASDFTLNTAGFTSNNSLGSGVFKIALANGGNDLVLNFGTVPVISSTTSNQTLTYGSTATFTVNATASTPAYQWRKGGSPITGATASTFSINPVHTNDAGSFDVVITNVVGSTTSSVSTLTVNQAALNVTANDTNRAFGAPNPTLTFSITGFVNGETLPTSDVTGVPVLSTTADTNSTVAGSPYTITVTTGTLSSTNYSFNTVNGNLTVNPAGTSLALTASANPSPTGSNVTFTATLAAISPSTAVPTGSVQFLTNGTAAGSPVTLVNGVATLSTSALPHATNTVQAQYASTSNFTGSTNSLAEVINTTPVAGLATFSRPRGMSFKFTIANLLTNASDADSDVLHLYSVSATSTNGAVVATNSLYVLYSPPATNADVTDSFTYTVVDTFGATNAGTVLITIAADPNTQSVNITGIQTLPDGNQRIGFAAIPNRTYLIQAATNLTPPITWTTISTNTAGTNGLFTFDDLNATNFNSRFYRTALP